MGEVLRDEEAARSRRALFLEHALQGPSQRQLLRFLAFAGIARRAASTLRGPCRGHPSGAGLLRRRRRGRCRWVRNDMVDFVGQPVVDLDKPVNLVGQLQNGFRVLEGLERLLVGRLR